MRVHYLEIVTKDVDAICKLYSEMHDVTFGEADPSLGGARTAQITHGGMMGIRAPMHDGEKSVTRAYMLVEDIEAAVAAAARSGAEIAVPPMKIPGHGTCAILIQGGIEAGLWQL
jgi:predicted enzyme related to lactoylglutathione lyase